MGKLKAKLLKALPTVMTVVGAGGTIAATVLAAKEGPEYQKALSDKAYEKGEKGEGQLTKGEEFLIALKIFAPAIGCAAVSIACTVGAHCMDLHTQASITGAYVAIQEAFKKYREKNVKLNGQKADDKIMAEIVEERIADDLKSSGESNIYEGLEDDEKEKLHKFYDPLTNTSFEASWKSMLNAELEMNRSLATAGVCTVNDWLDYLNLPMDPDCGDQGWSSEYLADCCFDYWLKFEYIKDQMGPDGEETIIVQAEHEPINLTEYDLMEKYPALYQKMLDKACEEYSK